MPGPVPIVAGVLIADGVTILAGESSSGKTFVALDLAAAVAEGAPWHGRQVTRGSVLYASFEGDDLGRRVRAMREAGRQLAHLALVRASDPLSPVVTRGGETVGVGEHALVAAIVTQVAAIDEAGAPPVRLLVIDTVRASMSGNEDSSEETSAYLRAVRRILATLPGAAALLIHHSGWQDGANNSRRRERGSSAWRGNVDATVYLEVGDYNAATGEGRLTLLTLKLRDGEAPPPLALLRRRVELPGQTPWGERATSCVIEYDRRALDDRVAEHQSSPEAANAQMDLDVLRAIRASPEATCMRLLRGRLGLRGQVVQAAVKRLLVVGWILEGKRGQPYTLTPEGVARLDRPAHHLPQGRYESNVSGGSDRFPDTPYERVP